MASDSHSPQRLGPHRSYTVSRALDSSQFSDAGDFTATIGKEFFIGGEVIFPPSEVNIVTPAGVNCVDGFYKTHLGWGVMVDAHIWGRTNLVTRYASRRLTAARLPLQPGRHRQLLSNQQSWLENNEPFLKLIAAHYEPSFTDYRGLYEEARLHHADPHKKRLLRIKAWEELHSPGTRGQHFTDRLWAKRVKGKIKSGEWAKFAKAARIIVDLGVSASLQTVWLAGYMKKAQMIPLHSQGGVFQFIPSPKASVLGDLFCRLIQPHSRFLFCYFSDDSCLSIKFQGRLYRFNVDISKCDAGHSPSLFEGYIRTHPSCCQDDARVAVEQCQLPIQYTSTNRIDRVILQAKEPHLYSGSGITTTLNNLASLMIGWSCCDQFDGTVESLVSAAATVGYLITVEVASCPEEITFLKNRPVRDITGQWRAVLCYGVFLRATGNVNGDLPGSKKDSLKLRASRHQASLVRGSFAGVITPVVSLLETAAGSEFLSSRLEKTLTSLEYKHVADTGPFIFNTHEFFARYQLAAHELLQILEHARTGFGTFTANEGLSKILHVDYGLTCVGVPPDRKSVV